MFCHIAVKNANIDCRINTNTNRYWTKAIWPVYPDLSVILQGSTRCYDVCV